MRIFYLACDIALHGGHGGATHVAEVSENLAALGHEVHVFARGRGAGNISWHRVARGIPRRLRVLNAFTIRSAFRCLRPDVIIERYYNFGGEGAWVTLGTGVPFVLEVNSPMVEYPGSAKDRIDRWLLFGSLERYRNWQARHAALIVTPQPAILPPGIDRSRVVRLPWGANTSLFQPRGRRAEARQAFGIPANATVVLFCGSFRGWHGAEAFAEAACEAMGGPAPDLHVLMIGDGETLPRVRSYLDRHAPPGRVHSVGRVAYERVPEFMEAADFAVAPFDPAAHPYLRIAFYWSPLKIFEAMAMGLPVVTIRRPELEEILAEAGAFYPEGDRAALTRAIVSLANDARVRQEMGVVARERAPLFSWRAHCEALASHLAAICHRSGP